MSENVHVTSSGVRIESLVDGSIYIKLNHQRIGLPMSAVQWRELCAYCVAQALLDEKKCENA